MARKEPAINEPTLAVYAGTSHRRHSFLAHVLPGVPLGQIEGGEEPDIANVVRIMQGKIRHVLPAVPTNEPVAIVAADTRTSTLTVNEQGQTYVKSRGKPRSETAARDVFGEMVQAHEKDGTNPYYVINSGSGLHLQKGRIEENYTAMRTSVIELDINKVRFLATEAGFETYKEAMTDFYGSGLYVNHGYHKPIGIKDLSGGMSIPVLTKMGVITSIDGVERDNPEFRVAFLDAFHNAAIGISPHVLRRIQPNIDKLTQEWDWANRVADYVLTQQQATRHVLAN